MDDIGFVPKNVDPHGIGFVPKQPDEVGTGEAFMKGLIDLPFVNQAAGAVTSPVGAIKSLAGLGGVDMSDDKDVQKYAAARDSAKQMFDAAQSQHPVAFGAGNVLNALGVGALTAGAGPALEGAGLGARALQAAKIGGAYGAVAGASNSQADLTHGNVAGELKDTGIGALEGAGTGAALTGLTTGAKGLYNLAKQTHTGASLDAAREMGENLVAGGDNAGNLLTKSGQQSIMQENRPLAGEIRSTIKQMTSKEGGAIQSAVDAMGPEEIKDPATMEKIMGAINGLDDSDVGQAADKERLLNDVQNRMSGGDIDVPVSSVEPGVTTPAVPSALAELKNKMARWKAAQGLVGADVSGDIIPQTTETGEKVLTPLYKEKIAAGGPGLVQGALTDAEGEGGVIGRKIAGQNVAGDEELTMKPTFESGDMTPEEMATTTEEPIGSTKQGNYAFSGSPETTKERAWTGTPVLDTPGSPEITSDPSLVDAGTQKVSLPNKEGLSAADWLKLKRTLQDRTAFNGGMTSNQGSNAATEGTVAVKDMLNKAVPGMAEANRGSAALDQARVDAGLSKNPGRKSVLTGEKALGRKIDAYERANSQGATAKTDLDNMIGNIASVDYKTAKSMLDKIQKTSQRINVAKEAANMSSPSSKTITGAAMSASSQIANVGGMAQGVVNKYLVNLPKQNLYSLGETLSGMGGVNAKLGAILKEAATRDQIGRNAILFSCMQSTAYRDLLNSFINEK